MRPYKYLNEIPYISNKRFKEIESLFERINERIGYQRYHAEIDYPKNKIIVYVFEKEDIV